MNPRPPFNLVRPPRHVPLLVRGRILFGGLGSQCVWFWFGASMFCIWLILHSITVVMFFPSIIMGIIIAVILSRRRKAFRLLARGELTTGVLINKQKTGWAVGRSTVGGSGQYPIYKLTFEFTVAGQTCEATAKTHEIEKLEDDDEEPLLYDPVNPAYAAMLDHLPGAARIDDNGEVRANNATSAVMVLVIPAATIIGHGLFTFYLLFG